MRIRKLTAMVLALCLTFALSASAFAALPEDKEVKITIIHTNDVHSRVDMEAYVSTLVKEKKAAGENVLLLSAGDVLHGQPIATLSRGKNVVDLMNAVGYDAMAPGNHDFNYGWQRLETLNSYMNFPILAANVTNAWTGKESYKPYIIKEIDGARIGIFGLATPETVTKTNPNNVNLLTFENPQATAQKIIRELELAGCDAIICLSHLGIDEETLPSERSAAVAELGGVNLLVDGHSHHALPAGQVSSKGTLTVQSGSYGENIGVVEMTISGGKVLTQASLVPVPAEPTATFVPDPDITALIARLNNDITSVTSQVVASTSVFLQGEREYARTQETNLGNLICDAMLYETGADVALTNGGGIRASIPAGNITKGDVLTVLPFGNYIVVKTVTGADLLAALEHGIASYPATAGGFPQIGGMSFTFDAGKPAGSRVVSAQLKNGTAIDPKATYRLATNDFMAAGGDGYEMLGTSGSPVSYAALDEALITYLQTGPAIPAGPQGRIVAIAHAQVA